MLLLLPRTGKCSLNGLPWRTPQVLREHEVKKRSLTMNENRPRTVLLVEDDRALSYSAARYLSTKGFNVIEAPGSMAALREFDSENVDVVVADLVLQPNEPHGLALSRMIAHRRPGTPVLLITGHRDLIEQALSVPCDVLYKPIEMDELARKIDELWTK